MPSLHIITMKDPWGGAVQVSASLLEPCRPAQLDSNLREMLQSERLNTDSFKK